MIFTPTMLEGKSFIIDIEPYEDIRGFLARTVCKTEFEQHGLNSNFVQQSISFNPNLGTLRGMHYQAAPFEEEKLVRVTRGAIFDVIVDISPNSKTYKKWFGVELSENNRRQIYIPKGFAHGFQTLEPNTEVLYEMTSQYQPDASTGFIWSDPLINIEWPETKNRMVGIRDVGFQNLSNEVLHSM